MEHLIVSVPLAALTGALARAPESLRAPAGAGAGALAADDAALEALLEDVMRDRLFHPGPLRNFRSQLYVCLFQRLGPLYHQRLKVLRCFFALLDHGPHFVLMPAGPQGRLHGAYQSHGLDRPFQQRNIPQRSKQLLPPRHHYGLLLMTGEEDERKVGPAGL